MTNLIFWEGRGVEVNRILAGISVVGIFFLSLGVSPSYSAEFRVAVVDMQRAVAESKAGRKARATLEREKKRLEEKLIEKRKNLEKLVKQIRDLQLEIQQKGPIWRPEERDRKNKDLRNRRRIFARNEDELKRLVLESRRELSIRQRKLTNDLIKQTREVVQEISRKGKFDIVIDRTAGGVIFAKKSVDITDQVIELYDIKKK